LPAQATSANSEEEREWVAETCVERRLVEGGGKREGEEREREEREMENFFINI
jgi:hypothetical protein